MIRRIFSERRADGKDELNQLDLTFVVDTTGSMGAFIAAAREQMVAMLRALGADSGAPVDLRVGLAQYRDHPPQDDTFVFRPHPFTGDLHRAQGVIERLRPAGGGDEPEAVLDGLCAACEVLNWRPHARRLAVLVGDAPPHGVGSRGDGFPAGCPCGLTLPDATAIVEGSGVSLYALALTPLVADSFAQLAHLTGGDYFNAEQGPAAIEMLRNVLASEFGDLDFDRRVHRLCWTQPDWTVDRLGEALGSPRGRISASLSRLGRRGLLAAPEALQR